MDGKSHFMIIAAPVCGRVSYNVTTDTGAVTCGNCVKTDAYREASKSGMQVLADLLSLNGGKTQAKVIRPDYPTAVGTAHDGPDCAGPVELAVRQARADIRIAMDRAGINIDHDEAHALLIRAYSKALEGGRDDAGLADRYRSAASVLITEAVAEPVWEVLAFDRFRDLFDRAVSLGYTDESAARLADCWENWDMITDPCAFHPNHSVSTDGQGYAVDGCEACRVIVKSTGEGFVPHAMACRVCHSAPVSTTLDTHSTFMGSMSAPRNTHIPVCDACLGRVLDTCADGEDHTTIVVVWPYLSDFDNNRCFVLIEDRANRYPAMDLSAWSRALCDILSPGYHVQSAGYIVINPASREAYDVSVDGRTSKVMELSPSEVSALKWEHYDTAGFRIDKRLHIILKATPGRVCAAESPEVFKVLPNGIDGPVYNRHHMHRIVKFTGDRCCERAASLPEHLHMSAMASVISLHPSAPEVRIECKLGDVFTVDGVKYRLTNQRHGDPVLTIM